jgi:hypothetical protein
LGTPLALVAFIPIRTLWLARLRTGFSLVRFGAWRWIRFLCRRLCIGLSCRSIPRLVFLVLLSVLLGRLRIDLLHAKHEACAEKQT